MAKKEIEKIQRPMEAESIKPTSKQTLVFISHDSRDAELAEAFSELLSNSSMGILKSFRSSDKKGTQGIDYGTMWYPEIIKKLNEATDVVCLLTQHSIAIMDFERVLKISMHNPFFEEIFMRNKENYMMFRELPHILEKHLHRILNDEL